MAGELLRATVKFPYISGLPRDVAQNVLHIKLPSDVSPGAGITANWNATIKNAYNNTSTTETDDIAIYMATCIQRDLCTIDWAIVDMPSGDVSEVMETHQWELKDTTSSDSLPLEVALCITLEGLDPGTGPAIPKRNRRGRVYIGPLNANALGITLDSGMPVPDTNLLERAAQWGAVMMTGNNPGAGVWSVYSRVREAAYAIAGGWVDNEYDTQRRREMDATQRIFWP